MDTSSARVDLLSIARQYVAAGLSVLPVLADGTKKPALDTWKYLQATLPTSEEIEHWFRSGSPLGIGIIGGQVSRFLEILDFDDVGIYQEFLRAADATGLGDLIRRLSTGCEEASPRGIHLPYYCSAISGNTKLAKRPATEEEVRAGTKEKALIETRGEGGYVVAAPSCGRVHESGKPYHLLQGSWLTVELITPEERADLWDLCRTFDRMPLRPEDTSSRGPTTATGTRPGDLYAAAVSWAEILEPAGWTWVYHRNGVDYWRRPGKDRGISATTNYAGSDYFYCFSSSTLFDAERGYGKFSVYAWLYHQGDFHAASCELLKQGYGLYSDGDPKPMPEEEEWTDINPEDTSHVDPPPDADPDDAENAKTTAEEREPPFPDTTPLDVFGDSRLIGSPPFPLGVVPSVLERRAVDIAERLGVDPAMVVLPMLAVCASAIDDRIRIYPLQHDVSWTEAARLWIAVIADSGQKKTPALNAAIAPLRNVERTWTQEDKDRVSDYQEEHAIYQDAVKLQRKAYAKAMAEGREASLPELPHPPRKPLSRRKEVKDTTIEALSEVMVDNTWSLIAVYDELTGWFGNFDAYRNSSIKRDRSLYLESYNGGPQLIDRVSRGRVYVPNWSLSLVGGIQPDAMRKLAGQLTDDGLAQRFVVAFIPSDGISVDRAEDTEAKDNYDRLISRLCSWNIGGPETRIFCHLTPEAHAIRELLNTRIRQVCWMPWVTKAFQTHLSKWEGLFPRFCLVWHCIEHNGEYPFPETISIETAQKVFRFMLEYLLPHAARFYTELLQTKDEEYYARWIAGHILAHDLDKITVRDIGRVFRPLRGDIKEIQKTMEMLGAVAWVAPADNGLAGGHRQWKVNPAVHARFAAQKKQEKHDRSEAIRHIQEAVRDFPILQPRGTT